ncbi:tetratricopeptide repeat domain 27 [Coprinopsis cinerea okayama7|uniref:Tetratricopeptide repeat domain 27 n=1 Tax=Coprinopsis cinerea (strain Okayama-7 / 130 / ATCC MYA-4618 / FGSC 9003) TaxID=240176 RepID=A8P6J9_COPC7|nr:tetratricopeptide repeat domain 27 [Coprinopsis cinerea okayama7\|eukprot:XP_001839167.1 tetratricopeptide repeat domain 27 [Coprinopsis cinerea okayama7\
MATSSSFTVEKSLLEGKWTAESPESSSKAVEAAKQVVDGDFRSVLTSPFARKLFRASSDDLTKGFTEIIDFSVSLEDDPVDNETLRLCLAVACLHAYVQANWTGPKLNVEPLDVLAFSSPNSITEQDVNSRAIVELAFGGEPAYHLAEVPVFLRLAQLILATPFTHLKSASWWRLRTTIVHQRTLDEPVAHSIDFQHDLDTLSSLIANDRSLSARLTLETGLLHHTFQQDKVAAEQFVASARITGMEYELTGALGKRTKFQVNDLSQLVLLAESKLEDDSQDQTSPSKNETKPSDTEGSDDDPAPAETKMPETLALNDDTLLEQTEFTSSRPNDKLNSRLGHIDPSAQPALHPLDQCILLSLCLNVRNTSPAHGLTNEQMAPYVARVISHPRNWSVHTMALLLRSRLESTRTRTVERSTFQLQALIDQMPTSDSTLPERLLYFHSIPLPSKWEMERELALRYMSLGVVKSALEIFERLEMWEDAIKCWAVLERPEKGIAILRDLLEGKKEEVDVVLSRGKATSEHRKSLQDATREAKLWCILGDLEPDNAPEHYQHAWEVSRESSGRAMRSLGGYWFARGKYTEAIECLKRAVAINPLQQKPWFLLGCAAMRLEDWALGRDAFIRCVTIDEEDGESWSNLASMYLRLSQSPTASIENKDEEEDEETTNGVEGSDTKGDDTTKAASVPFSNKMLAFQALKQGLRFSYNNWRVWYNYMIVAVDVGEMQEAARALGRVVEMVADKEGADSVDDDVLDRLVDAVTRAPANPDDAQKEGGGGGAQSDVANPNEGHGLYRSVKNLFDRTLLPRVASPRIFRAYARLWTWQSKWEEALKAYLDAYRCGNAGTMEKGETDIKKWREATTEVEDIVDVLRNFGPRVEGYKWRLQARSIVRTFTARTKDFEDEPEWGRLKELQEELKKEEE